MVLVSLTAAMFRNTCFDFTLFQIVTGSTFTLSDSLKKTFLSMCICHLNGIGTYCTWNAPNYCFIYLSFHDYIMSCHGIWILYDTSMCKYADDGRKSNFNHLSQGKRLLSVDFLLSYIVRYILSSVWVRLSIFSQLSIIQYMGLCVFS